MSIIGVEARAGRPPQPEEIMKDVPLELFGGLCSEMQPGDLPQGASPLCQDMDFELGATFTRYGLTALFAGQVSGNINYIKAVTLPNREQQTLVLDSAGNFYYEDVTNNPGVLVRIRQVIPGSFAHSVTAFGREFISFHNHITGTDIPMQWDGTTLERVSQDGPGAPPVVGSISAALTIVSLTQPPAVLNTSFNNPIRGITWNNGPGLTGTGNIVTIYYSLATDLPDPNIYLGANVFISGMFTTGTADPNGLATVTAVGQYPFSGTLYNTFSFVAGSNFHFVDNVPAGAGYQATLATVVITPPSATLQPGSVVAITGTSTVWDQSWPVETIPITSAMEITQTDLTAGVATYHYTPKTNPKTGLPWADPVAGQLVTVVNSENGGGIFNVVNAPITFVGGGTFQVALTGPNIVAAFDVGTATVQGSEFTFDPALDPTFQSGNPIGPTGVTSGDVAGGGIMAAGSRQCVVMFETDQGFLSRASAPVLFFLSSSANAITASGIPTGPSNVVKRVLAFTAANGDFFFWLAVPVSTTTAGVTTTSDATVINDNVTTSVTLNFTDADLLSGASIDQPGTDQFAMETLGPSLGVNTFADRMAWWGERNANQSFVNMSFDGGFDSTGTVPLGWAADPMNGPGGAQSLQSVWGFSYQITGDGVSVIRGMITQSAALDWEMQPILLPNTSYSARVRLSVIGVPSSGNFVIELYSPTQGSLGTLAIPLADMTRSPAAFSLNTGVIGSTMPAIPNDLVLRIYTSETLSAGASILVDELALYPTNEPVINARVRMSYADEEEQFDGVTGFLGITKLGSRSVTATAELRDSFYVFGDPGIFGTEDDDQEPSFWKIRTVSEPTGEAGCSSVDGIALGKDWMIHSCGLNGEYIFNGNEPIKISQEIQPDFSNLTPNAVNTTWKINDVENSRILAGYAINGSSLPNIVYVMSYKEMSASWEIADQKPIHISYSGRMVAWDMSRKWCPWNIVASSAALVTRQDGSKQIWFGNGIGTSKIYFYDPSNRTGDDGVVINSIYYPFFFVNRDMEQMMQMGLGRKYYDYIRLFVSGAGMLSTVAQSDSLNKSASESTRHSHLDCESRLRP